MYKLLASDIDGTILDHGGVLPAANERAIRRLHDGGVPVVLSSGRATASMRQIAQRLGLVADDTYLISYNGAVLAPTQEAPPILVDGLDSAAVADLAAYANDAGLHIQGYTETGFVSNTANENARVYAAASMLEYDVTKDLAAALPDGSPKLLIIGQHEQLLEHQRHIETLAAGRWRTTFSNPSYLEIVGPKVSKGTALSHLAERLGIAMEEVVAVGDSLNDVEMIQAAGLGIAVQNALDEVKAHAQMITSRSVADGAIEEVVAHAFDHVA